jgi:GGDEF domain-containing protein
LPKDYQLYLANRWGDFLVHPDPAQTFGFDKGRRVLMQDSFAATKPCSNASKTSWRSAAWTTRNKPPDKVMAFVRHPLGRGNRDDFIVTGLVQPLDTAVAGAAPLGQRIIHMVLAFSVIAIMLAVVFARAMLRPINTLAQAASSFSTTQLQQALPVERNDEIGVLARNFDRMQRQINSHMASLYDNQRELSYLAHHDSLTGLANRALFFQRLEQLLEQSRNASQFAVLFVDLDHFKQINDQHGHAIGDQVLQIVARRLLHAVRGNDMVARMGGDEYLILLQGSFTTMACPSCSPSCRSALANPWWWKARRWKSGPASVTACTRVTAPRPNNWSTRPTMPCIMSRPSSVMGIPDNCLTAEHGSLPPLTCPGPTVATTSFPFRLAVGLPSGVLPAPLA